MSTIVNLRGTSGAGKSTVVHTLLSMYQHQVVEHFGVRGNRPLVYELCLCSPKGTPSEHPRPHLYVVGPYKTQCGGCDAITGYQDVLPPLLTKYARKGDILFEGLLISGGYGSVGRAMGRLMTTGGHSTVFALLDTPLELCLERVNARRRARGVEEPVNPKNTEQKYKAAHASQRNIAAENYGHSCVMINHKRPVRDVLALFGVDLKREPRHASAQG